MSDTNQPEQSALASFRESLPAELTVTRELLSNLIAEVEDGRLSNEAFSGNMLATVAQLERRLLDLENARRNDKDGLGRIADALRG